jgi:hypothetical protein
MVAFIMLSRAARRAAPKKARAPAGGWSMYPSAWGQS